MTDKALRDIFNENYTGPFHEDLWKITTGQLNKAVESIYGDVSEGTPDKLFSNKIKFQNSMFSAFKSANETTTLRHLKIASKASNFTEFKRQASSIIGDYNKNWLKAEYRAAKARIRSAKNFRQAVKDSDIYPNIQYLPSIAQEPREEHKKYYYIIRPVGDAFWNNHLPPLTWGCQCQWKTTGEETTPLPNELPKPSPGLDINTGKTGTVFSNSHPYFDTDEKMALAIAKQNIAYIHNAQINDFTMFLKHAKTNGCVYSFDKLGGNEAAQNIKIAKVFASMGNEVQLFSINSIDSMVNGIWNEFKTTTAKTKSSVDYLIRKANLQFANSKSKGDITFMIKNKYDINALKNGIRERIYRIGNDKLNIFGIHFLLENNYLGYATIGEILAGKWPL